MNHFKNNKSISGFTLIEIVVVISIMGLLTVMIYSSFDKSKAKSRDQKRVSDISAIQLSLEQYFSKNGIYPLKLEDMVPKYISEIPKDPTTNISYASNYFPITKTQYSSACISYHLWATMEQANQYLDTKKGFNSVSLPYFPQQSYKNLYECGSGHTPVDATNSKNPLIYDVTP